MTVSGRDEPARPAAMPLRGCARPLAQAYDAGLLDLDGVVYVGTAAVAGAPDALAAARRHGMRLAFVTNNASRPPATVAAHLRELGIPAQQDDVVTSAQAAARVLAERVPAGSPVLVVGGEGLEEALRERGLKPVTSADDNPVAVVQGFAPQVGWQQLAEGTLAVDRGLFWVASNLDHTIPLARGRAPGNGALVDVIRGVTGRRPDAVAGKPELPLHRESIERCAARTPLVVGDRLDTDIEGAVRGGTDSLLVFSGVTSPAQALTAPAGLRPTYLAKDVSGLLDPHPEVGATSDGGWRCVGWRGSVRGGVLALDGGGEPYDGLRAACAAAWTAAAPVDATQALAVLGL